jgi:hypothetical protein
MRSFRPGCGTVENAQLQALRRMMCTAAPVGAMLSAPSLAPPASSSATVTAGSSDSRAASALPAEPAPITT